MNTVDTQNALGFQYSLFTNGDFISASNNLCIGNNIVINSTGLGPNIVNSNLTSLGTITNLSASAGSISNLYIGSSTAGSIYMNTSYAGSSTIGTLYTSYATSSNLSSSSGTITNLYSNSGTIGNLATNLLQLNQGTSNTLFVKSGTINNLSITNGTASNFYIQSGTISNLIVNGNTNNIPPIYITSATPNQLPANNYFNGTIGITPNNIPATQNISLQAANSIWTQGAFIASSDQRIKTNIKIADTSIALQNILDLPLMSFSYIDTIENGSSPVVGMIAQNVKQVVPEAITLALGTIPSIYKLADNIELVDENVLLTVSYNDNNMMIEGKLELTVEDIGKILVDIIDLGINTITVSKWNNFDIIKSVFIYGPQINDFHTVDEPYLGILCMGGIQELNNIYNTSVDSINSSISNLSTNVDTNVNTINQTLDTINSHLLFLDNTTQTANGNITILQTNTTSLMNLMDTIYRGTNSLTLTNSIPIQEPITSDIMVGNILLGYDSNNHTSIQSVIPASYSLAGGRLDLCTARSNKDPRQVPRISILSGAGGNGNVGIGTTNPSTNLEVVGTARITNTLLVNNIVMGSTTLKNSGNNSTNFILPDSNGNNGNVLITDGNGKTNWNDLGIDQINNKIDIIFNNINNIDSNINVLQSNNITIYNNINTIDTTIGTINSDINIINSDITNINSYIDTLQIDKTSLTNQLNTIYRGANTLILTNSIPIQEPIINDIMVGNILLGYDSNNYTSIQSVIPADYSLACGRLDLCTAISNKDSSQVPRITILSGAGGNGNVGIGTTKPSTNLEVIGTARISNTLLVDNIVMGSTTLKNSGNNSTNFILPNSNGNNGQILSTDGNGNTSWVDNKQPIHIRYSDIPNIISYWDPINNNYNTVSNYNYTVSNYYYLSWVNNIPKDQINLSNNNWNNGLFTVPVNGLYNINISLQTNTQVYLFISKGNDSNPAISSSTNIINNLTDYNTLIISNISNNINNQFYITNINTIVSLLTTDYLIFGLYSMDNGALIANSSNIGPNSQFTITLVQRT